MLFKVYPSVSENSLSDFLTLLPSVDRRSKIEDKAKQYFLMMQKFIKIAGLKTFKLKAKRSKETNIIESFNFYCRNFNPCLGRKSVTYAKTLSYFNQRMIEVITRWLDQFNLQYFLKINT